MNTAAKRGIPDLKRFVVPCLLILIAGLLAYIAFLPAVPCAGCNAKVDFVFSPHAEAEVVAFIGSARETVDIEMYTFSSDAMISAVGDAVKRGVRVRIIMEPRVEDSRKQKVFDTLSALGAEMKWASLEYKLTHSKFVIVDGKKVLIGSINFSKSALNDNREADAVVEGEGVKEIAGIFEVDWAKATAG
ncbi:MAG: phospholipase D family protein [Candidatus Micrarchaeia archaeon]